LGLHPADGEAASKTSSKTTQPDPEPEKIQRAVPKNEQPETPMPAIISRPIDAGSTLDDATPRWLLFVTLGFGALWLIGTLITANSLYSFKDFSSYSAAQFGGLAFLILFPLALLLVAYLAMRQLTILSRQSERLERAANDLMKVDETVVRRATEMSGVVKREIDSLNDGIDTALSRASTLQGVMTEQAEKLGETSLAVEDKTKQITERLATEREALWSISNTFDEQMKSVTQSLDTHSENLALSTKTAEQKIQEARISVENTASKINQTSDVIRSNTMEAATTLSGNQDEILRLSDQLKQRAEELDAIYQKHGQDLNSMIAQLRNEQEVLSQSLEERLSKMRDVALSAQVSAERLTEASEAGRQTVMSLSEAAQLSDSAIQKRFADLEQMVEFSNSKAESINEKAARRVQDSLAQTRKEIARIETDMMDLQEKLSSAATMPEESRRLTPAQPEKISDTVDVDAKSDVPPKKHAGALKLRPVDDEDNPIPPAQSSSALVAGLRPAPDPETEILPVSDSDPDFEIPELELPDLESDLDLKIEDGLISPSDAPPITRSTSIDSDTKSWWKNLFGRSESEPMPEPISNLRRAAPKTPEPMPPAPTPIPASEVQAPKAAPMIAATATAAAALIPKVATPQNNLKAPAELLKTMADKGLSPNAIVDTGCVIEAAVNRTDKGTKAMSVGVSKRLGEPVKLFTHLIQTDQELKTGIVNFAVKFHHSLAPIEDDQAALQNRLDTEEGRLFLMCDAALNG